MTPQTGGVALADCTNDIQDLVPEETRDSYSWDTVQGPQDPRPPVEGTSLNNKQNHSQAKLGNYLGIVIKFSLNFLSFADLRISQKSICLQTNS